MASMILASSPLSAQSFVKLRTNSNYSHSPCFVSRVKNSYGHLPYKTISHIESSKSLFIKGDSNFSFSSPNIPRVASTYSPSLNSIKASYGASYGFDENVYHFYAQDVRTGEKIGLGDRYKGEILLIVNLPQQLSPEGESEIEFLNDLRNLYTGRKSHYGRGFEVLGFFPMKKSRKRLIGRREKADTQLADGENLIVGQAKFPIFRKIGKNDNDHRNLWNFLRTSQNNGEMEKEFDKVLVDGEGLPITYFPWFMGETLKPQMVKPGENPGDVPGRVIDPTSPVKDEIDEYF